MKTCLVLLLLLLNVSLFTSQAANQPDGDNDKTSKTRVESNPSETWEFYSTVKEPTAEELAAAGNHKFGKEIGCLYNAFMETYVVKEEVVPGDPSQRTVLRKQGIQPEVRSIEKQLSKEVKKQTLTKEQAADEFENVLKIALAAIDSDTNTFEDALQDSKKDYTRLLAIFDNVKLKSLY